MMDNKGNGKEGSELYRKLAGDGGEKGENVIEKVNDGRDHTPAGRDGLRAAQNGLL